MCETYIPHRGLREVRRPPLYTLGNVDNKFGHFASIRLPLTTHSLMKVRSRMDAAKMPELIVICTFSLNGVCPCYMQLIAHFLFGTMCVGNIYSNFGTSFHNYLHNIQIGQLHDM